MYSSNRANATVRHEPRPAGTSNYSLLRILSLVLTILFSYSSYPAARGGAGRIRRGRAQLPARRVLPARGLWRDTRVEGWTTLVVLVAIFSGITIAMLSMIGEYVVRTLDSVSTRRELPRLREGHRMNRHFLGHRGPALRHDVPARAAGRPPGHRDGPAGADPSPRCSSPTRSSSAALEWYDRTWFAHAGTAGLLGEKSTSYLESPEAVHRVTGRPGRPADRGPAARPDRAGGVQLEASAALTGWRTVRSPRPSPATSTGRSPGTRSSRRSRPTPTSNAVATPTTSRHGSTRSRGWSGCSSSRTWSRTPTGSVSSTSGWASTPASGPARWGSPVNQGERPEDQLDDDLGDRLRD